MTSVTAAALVLALHSAAQAPASPANDKRRVLVLDLRNDGAKPEHARLVTDNIVVSLSRFQQLEVVSSEDVRRMVQTEGEKQALGCNDDSCLTEIASAMGAQLVVHGSIGRLENSTVVNLSLYDSKAGRSVGREAIQVQRLDDLPYHVEEATNRLVRTLLGDDARPRAAAGSSSSSAPAADGTPPPDGSGVNRVLAASVAGGTGCCLGGGVFAAAGAIGICGLCAVAPVLAGAAGGGAPFVGGLLASARASSLIVPAAVGGGAGLITAAITSGVIVASVTDQGDALTYLLAGVVGAIPVGLVTGAAVAIATGIAAEGEEPAPGDAPTAERALEKAPRSRYAMAY